MRCRHTKSWFLAMGRYEWCYECGAIRRLCPSSDGQNYSTVETQWTPPTGKGGRNPFPMKSVKPKKGKR